MFMKKIFLITISSKMLKDKATKEKIECKQYLQCLILYDMRFKTRDDRNNFTSVVPLEQ